jgi:hypothetical protein
MDMKMMQKKRLHGCLNAASCIMTHTNCGCETLHARAVEYLLSSHSLTKGVCLFVSIPTYLIEIFDSDIHHIFHLLPPEPPTASQSVPNTALNDDHSGHFSRNFNGDRRKYFPSGPQSRSPR